jgi:hypothetical protein
MAAAARVRDRTRRNTAMAVTLERARALLGEATPIYSLEQVESAFGVTFTPEQRSDLEETQFSEEALRQCVHTHLFFPGYPISLLDVRAKYSEHFYFRKNVWYDDEPFAKSRVAVRWHLVRKTPLPASLNRPWREQQGLLPPNELVPGASLVAFATMLHFHQTGEQLFRDHNVRVGLDSCGNPVRFGRFDRGLVILSDWRDAVGHDVGLATSRKPATLP